MNLWRTVSTGWGTDGLATGLGFVLKSCKFDLIKDELWDFVREFRCHWKEGRLGLEAVLVSNEGHLKQLTVGKGEAANEEKKNCNEMNNATGETMASASFLHSYTTLAMK